MRGAVGVGLVAVVGTLWTWVPLWLAALTDWSFEAAVAVSLAPLALLMAGVGWVARRSSVDP